MFTQNLQTLRDSMVWGNFPATARYVPLRGQIGDEHTAELFFCTSSQELTE